MIKIVNASKHIKNKQVLRSIELTFSEGKAYLIKGHNGSGKSMLLRLLCGLIKPTSGEVRADHKYSYGIIIENPAFLSNETAWYNLNYLANIQKKISKKQIEEILVEFNLSDAKNDKVKTFSLGMKQRLALCQAFMENPDVILLDEPFNALDEENSKELYKKLLKSKSEGKIIVIAAHGLDLTIDGFFDEVITMNNGEIKDVKQSTTSFS